MRRYLSGRERKARTRVRSLIISKGDDGRRSTTISVHRLTYPWNSKSTLRAREKRQKRARPQAALISGQSTCPYISSEPNRSAISYRAFSRSSESRKKRKEKASAYSRSLSPLPQPQPIDIPNPPSTPIRSGSHAYAKHIPPNVRPLQPLQLPLSPLVPLS
jgi:hypothetical protein